MTSQLVGIFALLLLSCLSSAFNPNRRIEADDQQASNNDQQEVVSQQHQHKNVQRRQATYDDMKNNIDDIFGPAPSQQPTNYPSYMPPPSNNAPVSNNVGGYYYPRPNIPFNYPNTQSSFNPYFNPTSQQAQIHFGKPYVQGQFLYVPYQVCVPINSQGVNPQTPSNGSTVFDDRFGGTDEPSVSVNPDEYYNTDTGISLAPVRPIRPNRPSRPFPPTEHDSSPNVAGGGSTVNPQRPLPQTPQNNYPSYPNNFYPQIPQNYPQYIPQYQPSPNYFSVISPFASSYNPCTRAFFNCCDKNVIPSSYVQRCFEVNDCPGIFFGNNFCNNNFV